MANNFSNAAERAFEESLEVFDSEPSTLQKVPLFEAPMTQMVRGGLTLHRPQQQFSQVVKGRDISGQYKDIIELFYPVSILESDISSVPFQLTAVERNDPFRLKEKMRGITRDLLAEADTRLVTEVANKGTQVSRIVGAADKYEDYSEAEAMLGEQGIPVSRQRCMGLSHRNWAAVAGDLSKSNGQFAANVAGDAYKRSTVPNIAGFDTYRAQYVPPVAASVTGTTINGAAQKLVPAPNVGSTESLQDNRTMNITVASTAAAVVGAAFTLAGVNSVDQVRKTDTGQLKTFRVSEVVDGTTLKIWPAIIDPAGGTDAEAQYGNVSAVPANGAALTWLNNVAATPSVFFVENAVEMIHAKLDVEEMKKSMGVMQSSTEKGIQLYMFSDSDIDDLNTWYRLSIWVKPTLNCPEAAGIVLPNQT